MGVGWANSILKYLLILDDLLSCKNCVDQYHMKNINEQNKPKWNKDNETNLQKQRR